MRALFSGEVAPIRLGGDADCAFAPRAGNPEPARVKVFPRIDDGVAWEIGDDRGVTGVTDSVLDALSARDIDAFVRCYAEDARIENPDGETLAFGRAEIRRRYQAVFAEFPAIAVRKLNSFTVGSYVVQEEEAIGRQSEPERHIAIYRIASGLIAHERLLR